MQAKADRRPATSSGRIHIQAQISLENVYVESPGQPRLDNTSSSK